MRTHLLLAALVAASAGLLASDARGDWVDNFLDGAEDPVWGVVGANGTGAGGNFARPPGYDTVVRGGERMSFSDADADLAPILDAHASLLGYVSNVFSDIEITSSVYGLTEVGISAGVAARMTPFTSTDPPGSFLGYSLTVTKDGLYNATVSLNKYSGASLQTINVQSLASVPYLFDEDAGLSFDSVDRIDLVFSVVGDQLTGSFAFFDASDTALFANVLTATDSDFTNGVGGVLLHTPYDAANGTTQTSLAGAAQWGPVSATAVPEPGTVLALSLLGGGAAFRRYRSRRAGTVVADQNLS